MGEPSEIVIGDDTTIIGTGSTDKEVASGTFKMELSASMGIKETYTGEICEAKQFKMPLGIGTVSWGGMSCPVAVGPSTVGVGVHMASILPAALAKADLSLTALDQDGEQALCVNTHLQREFELATEASNGTAVASSASRRRRQSPCGDVCKGMDSCRPSVSPQGWCQHICSKNGQTWYCSDTCAC